MSFVNKLLGIRGSSGGSGSAESSETADEFDYSTIDNCPYCHRSLCGYGCVYCNVEFVLEDSRLFERASSSRHGARQCARCDKSMAGGEFTAAWENGNNADAYITCPNCGYRETF